MLPRSTTLTGIAMASFVAAAAVVVTIRGGLPRASGRGGPEGSGNGFAPEIPQVGSEQARVGAPRRAPGAIRSAASSAERRQALAKGAEVFAPGSKSSSSTVEGTLAAARVIDLHTDLAYAVRAGRDHVGSLSSPLSPERLRQGNVGTLVVSLFVGKAYEQRPETVRLAYEGTLATFQNELETKAGRDLFGPIGIAEPAIRVGVVLSFEGADGFADDAERIVPWIHRGACLVGLVHDHTNALAGSSTDPNPERRAVGVTDLGRALAQVVVRHGGVLDAAHASDTAVDDLARIARAAAAPLVVSHTGLRSLCAIDRNLDDSRLRAVASTGGVVGIDLHRGHLVSRSSTHATLDDLAAHLEHAVRVAGIDHVALGSDFDGGIQPPRGVVGAEVWPMLRERLRARGWTPAEIAAVFHDNAGRVLAWAAAHGCGATEMP